LQDRRCLSGRLRLTPQLLDKSSAMLLLLCAKLSSAGLVGAHDATTQRQNIDGDWTALTNGPLLLIDFCNATTKHCVSSTAAPSVISVQSQRVRWVTQLSKQHMQVCMCHCSNCAGCNCHSTKKLANVLAGRCHFHVQCANVLAAFNVIVTTLAPQPPIISMIDFDRRLHCVLGTRQQIILSLFHCVAQAFCCLLPCRTLCLQPAMARIMLNLRELLL